jgi:hypothetical protein
MEESDQTKKLSTTEDEEIADSESYLKLQYEYKQAMFKYEKLHDITENQK